MAIEIAQPPLSIRFYLFTSVSSVVFLTIIYNSHLTFLLCLWTVTIGTIASYLVLTTWPQLPNLLYTTRKRAVRKEPVSKGCGICGHENCQRHRRDTNASPEPWNEVLIPELVDMALAEFFELVLKNFVYHWYREFNTNEVFVDELRCSLQYMGAILVQRASKVDIPKFLTGKLIQAGIAHLHVYVHTKRKYPHLRNGALADKVLQEYGSNIHEAAQGPHARVRYLQELADVLFPYILPPTALKCKSLVGFMRALWSYQLLTMACDTITNPDFVNKIILELLAPAKPVLPLENPTKPVPIMSSFVRSTKTQSALHFSLSDLLSSDHALLPFMQFMKAEGTTSALQFLLTLEDLTQRSVSQDTTEEEARSLLSEAKKLYETYFAPTAWDKIVMDQQIVDDLRTAVEALDADNPFEGVRLLKESIPLIKAYEHVRGLLETTYRPLFHHSDSYYEHLCGSRLPAYVPKAHPKKTQKRNRVLQPFKRLHSKLKDKLQDSKEDRLGFSLNDEEYDHCQMPSPMPSDDEITEEGHTEAAELPSPKFDMSKWNVKVTLNQSMKCTIAVDTSGASGDETHFDWTIRRQWKEFKSLDSQLRSFHDHLQTIRLPSKGFTLNVSRDKLNRKQAELGTYLKTMIADSILCGSQLLYSFLTPDSDEFNSKFALHTGGNKAGKMIKSVQRKLKKEKGQHLEHFLKSFLQSVEALREQPSEEMIAEWRIEHEKCVAAVKRYEMEVCDKGPDGKRYWEGHNNSTEAKKDDSCFQVEGVCDVVLYLVREVWHAPLWLHHMLCCAKLLGENTLEAFLDSYICGKLEVVLREDYVVDIIHLLRDALFYDEDPPRTTEQMQERCQETLQELINFPPHIVARLLGEDNYCEGMTTILEALQHPELNQHLFFVLLDLVVNEVFPEVEKENQQ